MRIIPLINHDDSGSHDPHPYRGIKHGIPTAASIFASRLGCSMAERLWYDDETSPTYLNNMDQYRYFMNIVLSNQPLSTLFVPRF